MSLIKAQTRKSWSPEVPTKQKTSGRHRWLASTQEKVAMQQNQTALSPFLVINHESHVI
jgi:hypothetical protein